MSSTKSDIGAAYFPLDAAAEAAAACTHNSQPQNVAVIVAAQRNADGQV